MHVSSQQQQALSNSSLSNLHCNSPSANSYSSSSSRDTTPVPALTSRTDSNKTSTPPIGSAVSPTSPSSPHSASVSLSPAISSTGVTFPSSQLRTAGANTRRAGPETPIDLRGLSALPAGISTTAAAVTVAASRGGVRHINLPTLKNPQGELLDLAELAGYGDGLTPTQETFPINTHSLATLSHTQSPVIPTSMPSPMFSSGYQSFHTSPASLASPSMSSLPSLTSLASITSSLSSLATSPSIVQSPSSQGSSSPSLGEAGLKTPNVYVNGLPPNFPEEELLAMTKPFGEVISVRTFTRHVSDKPSGYGFVLFGSVDAAEKCIEALRKYRNLHPSFSKQIHKIPGTSYATAHADAAINIPQTGSDNPDSFKSKMERLKDAASTNLYMEGLPLSIDEETLQALVNPYRIMSSRFFRTRLSNPPRIIAFVRLETRQAASDIIERLHGRMVRGWCDSGSRISVRFADTSEQRELRRVERMNRDGENSPARLTMAQAALLNLKGTQISSRLPSPNFGQLPLPPALPPVIGSAGVTSAIVEPAYVPTESGGYKPLPPPIGLHHQQQPDAQTLRNTLSYGTESLGLSQLSPRSLDSQLAGVGATDAGLLQLQMSAMHLGNDLAVNMRAQNGFTPMERMILQAREQRQQQEAQAQAQALAQLAYGQHDSSVNRQRPSVPEFNPSATEFNPSGASAAALGQLKSPVQANVQVQPGADGSGSRRRLMSFLPAMSEKDFHARGQQRQGVMMPPPVPSSATIKVAEPLAKPLKLDQESRVQFTRQRNQTHAEAKAQAQAEAAARERSTSVPSHYLNTGAGSVEESRGLGGSMHAPVPTSMTFGNAESVKKSGSSSGVLRNPLGPGANGLNSPTIPSTSTNVSNNGFSAHTQAQMSSRVQNQTSDGSTTSVTKTIPITVTTIANNNSSNTNNSSSARIGPSPSLAHSSSPSPSVQPQTQSPSPAIQPHVNPSPANTRIDTTTASMLHSRNTTTRSGASHDADDEDDEYVLASPALSYSARTSASLSPATPASAFGETFEGPHVAVVVGKGQDGPENVGLGMGVGEMVSKTQTQQQTKTDVPHAAM